MIPSNSIVLGFLRFFVMFLFLYLINKKWINKSSSNNFVEFVVLQWFKYGAILGIIIFITVQLNIFDLLNTLFILALLITIELIGIQNLKNPFLYFNSKIKTILIKRLKKIELFTTLKSWFSIKKKMTDVNHYFLYYLLGFAIVVTFITRFYFLKYDFYLLSNSWNSDLELMFNLDNQYWFYPNNILIGELAYTNFYAKIFDVSPEIALQSIGVFEAILLVIILFWLIRKCSGSEYFAPLITALSFAVFLTIIPVNLNFITQRNPIFLALTFAIPCFYYLLNPNQLKLKRLSFFLSFLCVFIIIGLIDLFTFCILIPPFILISIFLTNKDVNIRYWIAFGSFLVSIIILFGGYYVMCATFQIDFFDFIRSNVISVNSYTYNPQLIIPINILVNYYVILAFVGSLLTLYFILFLKENWNISLAFLLYFLLLIALLKLTNTWVDKDLMLQSLVVFFPIVIGISVGIILKLLNPITRKIQKLNNYFTVVFSFIVLYFAIDLQKTTLKIISKPNDFSLQILDVYDQIHSDYFPFSFAVVDQYTSQIISTNNHYFINYSEFLDSYLSKDAIYFKNFKKHDYFKKNPQDVLPNSILLFIYNDENSEKLFNCLNILKKRGRTINLFQSKDNFKVYEIINVPNSSKVSDLIF